MTTQLSLTRVIDESEREWVLDEQTRTLGIRRVAEARALLRSIAPPAQGDGHGDGDGEGNGNGNGNGNGQRHAA